MVTEFRAISPDEFETMRQTMGIVFGFDPPDGDERFRKLVPLERTRCGFEQGVMVATSGAFSLQMTVPGGKVPCGGTTMIAVVPSHRRRGLLREMMRAHLEDVREHEEPIAGLWASDSAIYGRFGYGCASICYEVTVDRDYVDLHRLAPSPAPVRMVDRDEAMKLAPIVYQELETSIPGFFRRSPEWWEGRTFRDRERDRDGATSLRFGVVDGTDGVAGYLAFRTKSDWKEGHGAGEVRIVDLFGTTPESWAGLWTFALNQDLVKRLVADLRPPDDPLFDLLDGTRRARAVRSDALWLRIMDVPAALAARAYSAPVNVVLGVSDPFGEASGAYRLTVDDDGVSCAPGDEDPEVIVDLEDLSAGYMGAPRFRKLARAGRLTGSAPALASLDAAFRWDPPPWCPELF